MSNQFPRGIMIVETFTVKDQHGKRFTVVVKETQTNRLKTGPGVVTEFRLEETGELLNDHPTNELGFVSARTGELYILVQ